MSYIGKSLTGKRRLRSNWRGKLILQVEQNVGFLENCGTHIDVEPGTIWRDATVSDVTRRPAMWPDDEDYIAELDGVDSNQDDWADFFASADYEAWRPALAAFYRAGSWFQSAESVERGCPLSIDDKRHIDCLAAAFERYCRRPSGPGRCRTAAEGRRGRRQARYSRGQAKGAREGR
jgi:hypothetical protein